MPFMPLHVLQPQPGQVVDAFSFQVPPAVIIGSGDRLSVRTLDAGGQPRSPIERGEFTRCCLG